MPLARLLLVLHPPIRTHLHLAYPRYSDRPRWCKLQVLILQHFKHEAPASRGAFRTQLSAPVEIAKPLGIAVHDHIIVGKDGHARLKGLKQFIELLRRRPGPGPAGPPRKALVTALQADSPPCQNAVRVGSGSWASVRRGVAHHTARATRAIHELRTGRPAWRLHHAGFCFREFGPGFRFVRPGYLVRSL